ncbi:hypothetical protein Droror1_Dr00011424 [Drosera rotundifolia]
MEATKRPTWWLALAAVVLMMATVDVVRAQDDGDNGDDSGAGMLPPELSPRRKELVPALFIFGDSLIDNGNNNDLPSFAKANYYPYGIDFNGGPTGRFSNGYTMVDEIGTNSYHFEIICSKCLISYVCFIVCMYNVDYTNMLFSV